MLDTPSIDSEKYSLTPEHEALLPVWRDRWIANAMSTKPMDENDRAAMKSAIKGLYEAAGKTPPQNIVFVRSPIEGAIVSGIAAAIWYLRKGWKTPGTPSATAYKTTSEANTISAEVALSTRINMGDICTDSAAEAVYTVVTHATNSEINLEIDAAITAATTNAAETLIKASIIDDTHVKTTLADDKHPADTALCDATDTTVTNAVDDIHTTTAEAIDAVTDYRTFSTVYLNTRPASYEPISGIAVSEEITKEVAKVDDATYDAITAVTHFITGMVNNDINLATEPATNDTLDAIDDVIDEVVGDPPKLSLRIHQATHLASANDTTTIKAATHATDTDAIDDAIDEATSGATDSATHHATSTVTRDVARAVTHASTHATTCDTLEVAINAATDDATDAATDDATNASIDTTYDAIHESSHQDMDSWIGGVPSIPKIIKCFGLGSFGLECISKAWRFRQGGNQWSGGCAQISFFREVAELLIDYTNWMHWENAAIHGGPRWIHEKFCVVSDRPEILTVDNRNRPHNADGPFCRWRDGVKLYSWHGVRVPAWCIEQKERINKESILAESNAEIRRAMCEIVGWEKVLSMLGGVEIDADECLGLPRSLIQVSLGEDLIKLLKVVNGTPEPQSAGEPLRPLTRDGVTTYHREFLMGVPVELTTCHAAVAWSYGVSPEIYREGVRA